MKKILSTIALLFSAHFICHSQDFPDFGIPTAEDFALTECAFEKNAAAIVLMDEGFSYPGDNTELITTCHRRLKILTDKGINAANISITFYREEGFESIDQLEAMTINMDAAGNIEKQKIDKASFYKTKIDELSGAITFVFPSVKKGSILEYQYRSRMKNYWGLKDWYFQDEWPVLVSRYHLKMIFGKQFTYKLYKKPEYEAVILPEAGKIFFEMRNIPGLQEEPYMDARRDNIQRIDFQVSNRFITWNSSITLDSVSTWKQAYYNMMMRESFWPQLENKISGTTDFIKTTRLLPREEEKMKAVYDHVKKNMTWNNIYSKTSPEGVNNAWKNGIGTSADINLILINLLQKAGLDANPILVSERFHGVVDTAYPYLEQFNTVFAAVVIGNKEYYLNAVDKYTPAHITPAAILNTTAFIITQKKAGLLTISNDSLQYKEGIYLDMKLSEAGILTGSALIKNKDYARIKKTSDFEKDKDKFKKKYTEAEGTAITINNYQINNMDNDSLPLDEKFEVDMKLNGSGAYSFIPLHLFSGFDKNPFISDTRFSNVNFGFNRAIIINSTIELPSNYTVDELPKSMRMETPEKDIVYSRQITFNKDNNTIYCNVRFENNKNLYETALYPTLKEAYKKLFLYLKEQVVLKKKS